MNEKKDWILENIRETIRQKGLKLEIVSKELGISQGEFSKILNGERENYFKHLPQIAQSLKVSFHELVTPKENVQNNYGEVKENSAGNVNHFHNNANVELYERIINKDEKLIAELTEERDNYKRKYEKCKAQRTELEKRVQELEKKK